MPREALAPAPRGLAKDIQVDGGRLGQGTQACVHVLDAAALLGLPLPAAPHDGVDLRGAGAGPLQLASLRDALDRLRPPEGERTGHSGPGPEGRPVPRSAGPITGVGLLATDHLTGDREPQDQGDRLGLGWGWKGWSHSECSAGGRRSGAGLRVKALAEGTPLCRDYSWGPSCSKEELQQQRAKRDCREDWRRGGGWGLAEGRAAPSGLPIRGLGL